MNLPSLDKDTPPDQLHNFMSKARAASELLKALSHETRLLILCILSRGEKTVGEIEAILGLQQAVVSQQLARLRMDHLVKTRRDGRMIYYSIDNPGLNDLISVLYAMYCEPAGPTAEEV
jgi:DNA-binding transcriptional ArsR family regulator